MDVQQIMKEIKEQLRLNMNGAAAQLMRESGLTYKVNFGVDVPRLKQIALQFEKNQQVAQALWNENIRECKILAGLLMPVEHFYPDMADIWITEMKHLEIAQLTVLNLFQYLPYAPSKSLQWIASDEEYSQICGFLTISHLLTKKNDLEERVENEFVDQAIATFLSGSYHVQTTVMAALRKYCRPNEEHLFTLCRKVEYLKDSENENERKLYEFVAAESAL